MKHIQRDLNSNRMIYKKYAKNYRHNMNILKFFKSNYKYKRRSVRCHINNKHQRQWQLSQHQHQQKQNQNQKHKHKLPANEETLKNDKQITKRIPFYENIKLDKFLRIFILIMQQATPTNNNCNSNSNNNNNSCCSKSKCANSRLVTQLVAKMKAFKFVRKSLANVNEENEDEDGISDNHPAYKDANKDTDINVDISSIADEISHQQHNYDKVSTITSTLIKCQRRKHHQIKATKSSSSSSHSTAPFSTTTTATMTFTALLSPPSMANCETYQWSAILHHYVRNNVSIHQHQYHHKIKHTLHHHQHALHIKSLTTSRVLNFNKSNNNNNSNHHHSSNNTAPSATGTGTSIYQSVDQYVNATWNHSYTLSCLLLTLFIAFTIGVRSTTAGACWQTVLDNGKCNEIFSLNISKSECCGANQEFAYTEREPTNVEYFFATAIGGGMECSPCLESCKNVKCGPNKKCVKRKGRPKCICAPECGAARRKRKQREHIMQQEQQPHQQHHTLRLVSSHAKDDNDDADDGGYFPDVSAAIRSSNDFKIKIEKSQQSRDTRSLSSEITNVNLGLENGKDAMISSGVTSSMERHHCNEHNQNQRKLIHIHHSHGQQRHTQQQVQQLNHKNQEPKGSRRVLITANVEHTEKPTTRRLQIFSNVRTTHARRHNSNNKNNNSNNPGQHEDTDPSDYYEENDEDYNYNDAEYEAKEAKKKNNYSSNIENPNNNNNNGHGHGHGSNKNNRNDESTRFLNQSPSRHKLKTNTKSNNNNNSRNRDRNTNNKNKNKNKNKNHHDLQITKIQQLSSKHNNTRVRHSQQNGHHAENTLHHGHHNHNHHSHHQHQHHHREQQQQQQHHHNQQHQSPNHGRHKHNNNNNKNNNTNNKQHHKQQSIILKMPKNNKDYNITTTTTTTSSSSSSSSTTTNIVFVNTTATASDADAVATAANASSSLLHQSRIVKTATTPTSLNFSSLSAAIATTITDPQHTQSQLLLSSSASSSFSSTTPVNSTMSADDDAAADDHYHSRLPNHGSKIAASSILSATSSSSSLPSPSPSPSTSPSSTSHLQLSGVSARSSSESAVVLTMSAKGEGVLPHDHKHRIEIPTTTKTVFNNNNNNDKKISTLQTNLHNNQKQQQDQQHYQTPLFDEMSEQFDLIGFPNKQRQQTLTNEDNVKPLNPVCGTDGRTYNTECQLRKRACRTDNSNLQIAYRGHCRTTCNGVKCLNGLTCVEDQYSMPHCITCKIECPQDDYDNDAVDATKAVCGADGKTYKSTCDINRMICKIGRSIAVAYPGPCREDQVTCDDINCGSKQVCLIDLLTHKPRCTSCRYKCSRKRRKSSLHYEEGKICGVNNRTYNSWCEMRKDSCSTGFYIDIKYSGDCH